MNQIETICLTALSEYGINISEAAFRNNCDFIKLLLEANQTVNLTAIIDYQEALYKHVFDSLLITKLPFWEKALQIIDVGSGAGIPAFPLALAYPEKAVLSLDATRKKVAFQQQLSQTFRLNNLKPLWGRAEEIGKETAHREQYDLVLARAVASINVLAELTIPFAKPSTGIICFYKGKEFQEELQTGQNAILILGGNLTDVIEVELPYNYGVRSLVIINKHHSTPTEFPRKNGIPTKKPL